MISKENDQVKVQNASCTCAKGQGKGCGHIVALLYQIASYKARGLRALPEDAAKTSLPQTWHKPRGQTIRPTGIQGITVKGHSAGFE